MTHYETEIQTLNNKLIAMCRAVEIAIEKSINALAQRDENLAAEVIKEDHEINRREHELENDCLKILLMAHPVARDFREVSAALKMITDLERIGDNAASIGEIARQFGTEPFVKEPVHIQQMAALATAMLKDSVLSYINRDLALARELDRRDDAVDELFRTIKSELILLIQRDGNAGDQAILFMMIAKYLERIADHAVNIGEWVEYAITGTRKEA